MIVTISKNGQAYLSKKFIAKFNSNKIKLLPIDKYSFSILLEHKKINTVYQNERGSYVYASKKLQQGKYLINENEGRHTIR